MSSQPAKQAFGEHLEELRKRLIRCFVALLIGFGICYNFKEKLFEILSSPLVEAMGQNPEMIYTGLTEPFFVYIKVAFLAGFLLISPYIFLEFWFFITPGLYKKEKMTLLPVVFLSGFFFVGGALFGYFGVFPIGFKFFLDFSEGVIVARPAVGQYFTLASKLLIAFGIVFELPLVLTVLARFGIVSVEFLTKNRKYALLLFFICGAILTPPDPVSQCMMAVPLIIMYELSIIGAKILGKKKEVEEDV
ncbi:MAG: twin-arginine translocase subunit TatC [Proteobacteria bacterium]|nr:twin-arginine translocase subunit TatC [Pseudomonadota bacterium]